MAFEPADRRPLILFDPIIIRAVAVVVALVAATSRLISMDLATGIIGLVVMTVAASRDISMVARTIAILLGLCVLAYGGWLDFEGWRFLPPRGPLGTGSP